MGWCQVVTFLLNLGMTIEYRVEILIMLVSLLLVSVMGKVLSLKGFGLVLGLGLSLGY